MKKPPMMGTILPTAESLAAGDAAADREKERIERIGIQQLGNLTQRQVGGETRYYDNTGKRYAIVNRFKEIRWFETRADGHDYPVK